VPDADFVTPPSEDRHVAVYPVIADPPLLVGALNETEINVMSGFTLRIDGARGAVAALAGTAPATRTSEAMSAVTTTTHVGTDECGRGLPSLGTPQFRAAARPALGLRMRAVCPNAS
jgi:hypothetical protein